MDRTSDNESEASFPEFLSREQMTEIDSDNLPNDRNNIERNMIDQRFYEMNRQNGELTDLVLALTQQISSNHREGNGLNMAKPSANGHSDIDIALKLFSKTNVANRIFQPVIFNLH